MILPFVLGIFRVGLGEGVVVCFLGRWVFIIIHSNASFLKRNSRPEIIERISSAKFNILRAFSSSRSAIDSNRSESSRGARTGQSCNKSKFITIPLSSERLRQSTKWRQ